VKSKIRYPHSDDIRHRLDNILPRVTKPSRYFAGEIGLVRKNWGDVRARIAIAFPDVYEIAVVNLGHKLMLHIINSQSEYLAERVYSPWPDMEEQLRSTGTPLYSLESFRPIASFDVLGVSLTHELSYTNLLQLIDLSGIPLKSEDRGFPIVIAGGPAVFNPEPIHEFVDAFVLGDGEQVVLDLVRSIADSRELIDQARGDIDHEKALKKEILDRWGGAGGTHPVQGVYIPRHFTVEHDASGEITAISNNCGGPDVVQKALVTDLDNAPWELKPLIPHMQGISSRVTIEPVRGCTHGCRFCQAGMIYRPYRERSLDLVLEQAETLLRSTGLQEQSFLALSATDWPKLTEYIKKMKEPGRDFRLKISLPSNRIAALDESLTSLLISNRKGGLTLAIETATQRLRNVINKAVTEDDIRNAITSLLVSGWDLFKLYFMIGLPSETDDDVLEIITLVKRIKSLALELKKSGSTAIGKPKIKVSVSSFVPKAHTPFQWAPMDVPETLDRKQKMLIALRKIKGVDYSSHDIGASWVEGMMSRGDRSLSRVILKAYELGARFDAWGDMCDPGIWEQAFSETGIEPDHYLAGRDIDSILPWSHLSCGVSLDWLKKEWLQSFDEVLLPDCNETKCHVCGLHSIYPDCHPMRINR